MSHQLHFDYQLTGFTFCPLALLLHSISQGERELSARSIQVKLPDVLPRGHSHESWQVFRLALRCHAMHPEP
jgi:hypothetical protein